MDVILVIDDSSSVRDAATSWLSHAGYEVLSAYDLASSIRQAKLRKPDLLMVDLSLHDMTGPALCEALYERADLGSTPVVFLSTPGEPLEPLVREHLPGSVIIPKPLRLTTLIQKVAQSLAQSPARRGERSDAWLARWADRIASAAPAARATELQACLQAAGFAPTVALSGDLATISAAELFQMLALQAQSGVLHVESRDLELDIHLQGGLVDSVIPRRVVPNLRLGKILVAQGMVGPDHVESALRAPIKPIGNALVTLGVLAEEQLNQALSFQSSELFYELIRQRSGRFSFSVDKHSTETTHVTRLGLDAETLLLEGCRRADESSVIEASLRPDAFVMTQSWRTDGSSPSEDVNERELLALCRAPRKVDELLREAGTSRFVTLQRLQRLVSAEQLTLLGENHAS